MICGADCWPKIRIAKWVPQINQSYFPPALTAANITQQQKESNNLRLYLNIFRMRVEI